MQNFFREVTEKYSGLDRIGTVEISFEIIICKVVGYDMFANTVYSQCVLCSCMLLWQYIVTDELISQCSTLVRNTVVRATFKVNGKPPILGSCSPLTPWPIDLKFHTGDYVGDMTPQAKNGKNRPRVKCEGQMRLFFIFHDMVSCDRCAVTG